ncbi:MAG: hypothetical protein SFW62_09530 [Alphaproteobacteria bacterium]|nr:hypothetical protein [Alphaproteobacteria bacterium]
MPPNIENPVLKHPDMQALHDYVSGLPAPFVIYNKSHSGSRLLTRALAAQGVFMGGRLNDSEDSLPFVDLIYGLVENYYPDYQSLWRDPEAVGKVARHALAMTRDHLAGYDTRNFRGWGWKLCESGYALPVLTLLFPGLRAIHLLRDGLDMAFTDHVAPELLFWRKIYFNTANIQSWRGLGLSNRSYQRRPHLFNAVHWANSVKIGRQHGSMLHERYYEVRYELLCKNFGAVMKDLLKFLALEPDEKALAAIEASVSSGSIGKYHNVPRRKKQAVLKLITPELYAFGYGRRLKPRKYPPVVARILDRFGRAG